MVYAYFTSYVQASGGKMLKINNNVQAEVNTIIENGTIYIEVKNIGKDERMGKINCFWYT